MSETEQVISKRGRGKNGGNDTQLGIPRGDYKMRGLNWVMIVLTAPASWKRMLALIFEIRDFHYLAEMKGIDGDFPVGEFLRIVCQNNWH